MIKHADLDAVSKVFGRGFSISFGPSRTSFGGMTQPVVLFSLASSGFLRVSGTTRSVSRAGSGSVLSFSLLLRFLYLPGRPSWMCLFDAAHFEFLIEIFKNFSNADCRTLHPPRAVVCRPQQTRKDVHILVATIQWSSVTVATWYFRNVNGSCCPKTCYCSKTWDFANLAGFLGFHTNNGFLHWKNISNIRHLALYSKQFQNFNFAPNFQNS